MLSPRRALRLFARSKAAMICRMWRLGVLAAPAVAACHPVPATQRLSTVTGPTVDPLTCLLDVRSGPFGFGDAISVGRLGPTGGMNAVAQLVVPERILFDVGSDMPPPGAVPIFDALAGCLQQADPRTVAAVLGHTDSTGSDDANFELSRRRATAVIAALIARGIDPQRLLAIAIGSRQPLAPNDTPENRQLNRRVEVLIASNQQAILQAVATYPSVGDGTPVDVLRPVTGAGRITLALEEPLGLPSVTAPRGALPSVTAPRGVVPLPSATMPEPDVGVQAVSPGALPRLPDAPVQSVTPAALPRLVPPGSAATPRNLKPAALPTLPKPAKPVVPAIPTPVKPAPLTDFKGD